MKTISIKGEIVSAAYDCDFFAGFIDNGVICPSSRAVKALAETDKDEDVTVFVDTPGGDVFAGDEIVIAARTRCLEKPLTVEIGSEACSMGANLVAALKAAGARVVAHPNSKVMFHSAACACAGGAELLKDRAALVEKINGAVAAELEKLGVKDTAEWFAEGREKWLGADDLLSLGLADEILGADSPRDEGFTARLTTFRVAALKKGQTDAKRDAADWKARYAGASKKINELGSAVKDLESQVVQLKGDLDAAKAEASALSSTLEEAERKLQGAEGELGEKADALRRAEEQVQRLKETRQLLTAGVLTPTDDAATYADRMAKARTAAERERLRALKAQGKIK